MCIYITYIYISFMSLLNFMNTWNAVMIIVQVYLPANSNFASVYGHSLLIIYFFPHNELCFPSFFMPYNFMPNNIEIFT